ncbi:hypothetical protein ACFSJU_13425 [Paradesertivirga mongoliensis]|uniref:DUF3139 domain-containing protein n=1 Tax=Paradesertivirga mongoliensis TaxID=2100740 RepID=A0ABW4ZPJ9_9SPHI|nr:hypothetical protein [Pedobacter mongoliensis]
MKTSNILLLSAIAVAIICLVAYNFELKAEYLTIKKRGIEYYKDNRFNEYHQVKISKFENLDFLAANCIRVNVEYGEKEAVWVRKWDKDYIKVNQDGNTVSVSLNKKGMEKLSDNRELKSLLSVQELIE